LVMKTIQIEHSERYAGLYAVAIGDQCEVGLRAEEVAAMLESERYRDAKVYKIYRAKPDGSMELHGVARERFFLESGMFFHCFNQELAQRDFEVLATWAEKTAAPCRMKVELGRLADGQFLLGLIYPAEYEQEVGVWLADSGYKGQGAVDAGVSQVNRYYEMKKEVLASKQLWTAKAKDQPERAEVITMKAVS